ncbi:MAG: SdpI family protein [Lachnospiraceae bacterium]|nr:SdpI family protein [Lachnospiraceae bacterium]
MGNKVKAVILWIIPAVCIFCSSITLVTGLGYDGNVGFFAPLFVGFIFIVIGNYLPKMKQSYIVGIKIPWTLSDEDNWNKTHRLAGFLWVISGIVLMAAAFIKVKGFVLIPVLIVMTLGPVCYSYFLYKNKSK